MHCPRCNTVLPDDARFCIECGTAVRVATGETVQLPPTLNAVITCPVCNTANPLYAHFCVYCGEAIQHSAGQPASSVPRTVVPPQPQPARHDEFDMGITLLLIGAALLIPIIF
ncbi:zinc ribbon domain-containing protein [Chloroflexus sp.]|uniref:zinc ribbon domain-containing protein n=1 Tax=Chloroflexus sp. TaxID=1904827 RepID=UPI002ADE2804|nr:zinc ribbon domain-containing protein [Chloroflexus sp.]